MNLAKKIIKRNFIFVCVAILFGAKCAAYDGVMFGARDLRVMETKWFDIIFAPASETTAKLMLQWADEIYEDVYASFDMQPFARMPLVITGAIDTLNAYFSSVPYNHIVVYDTLAEVVYEDSLAVFSESLRNVFKHECVHAATSNLKNGGWRVVGSVFGDVVNPVNLFATPGLSEGTAVVLESEDGEGRLHDGYSMHVVRQAKIENAFPPYADVQGAATNYPFGIHYQFNGAFYEWLRQKFGMEKLARLWYKCANFKTISLGVAFRSVYGVGITKAWSEFRDELVVPAIAASPLDGSTYEDLFGLVQHGDTSVFSSANKSASRYISLSNSSVGFICIDLASDAVLFFKKKIDGSYSKPDVLFRKAGIIQASISQDGNFVAATCITSLFGTTKKRVSIYDVRKRSFFTLPETGLHDASVLKVGGDFFLVCAKAVGQKSFLKIYSIDNKSGHISGVAQLREFQAKHNELFVCPVDSGNGKFAYILKSENTWNVVVQSFADGSRTVYRMPKGMAIQNISYCGSDEGGDAYVFSCALPDTFPRLARLQINAAGATLEMQSDDVSGGVLSPIVADDSGRVFYSGAFFRNNRLISVDTNKIDFDKYVVESVVRERYQNKNYAQAKAQNDSIKTSAYNPLKYYARGLFVPLSLATNYHLISGDLFTDRLWLGATYASSTPWSSSVMIFSGGFWPSPFEAALSAQMMGGSQTSLFSYSAQGNVTFDKGGFVQTFDEAALNFSIPFGRYFSINLHDKTSFFYGHSATLKPTFIEELRGFETAATFNALKPFFVQGSRPYDSIGIENYFSAGISSVHKIGAGYYEYGGASFYAFYNVGYGGTIEYPHSFNVAQNIGMTAAARLPRLLPLTNLNHHTYNLPFEFSLSMFPSSMIFLEGDANIVLYSYELQKALPLVSAIFIERFSIVAEYNGYFFSALSDPIKIATTDKHFAKLFSGELRYADSVSLRAMMTLTPNFGMLTALFRMTLNARVTYYISPKIISAFRTSFYFSFSI